MKKNHHRTTQRTWQTWDVFPFGRQKGVPLGWLADNEPSYLLWWLKNKKAMISDELKTRLQTALNLLR